MKEFEIKATAKEYVFEELEPADRRLVEEAKAACDGSYAPFSKFNVGAAILLANGKIIRGSNQENAAFPSGLCAERTAAFYASSAHPGISFKKIAIAARALSETDGYKFQSFPISPCGGCRQVLLEYEHLYGPIEVILFGEEKTLVIPSIKSLLPLGFIDF